MNRSRSIKNLRMLLVQARNGADIEAQEQQCFQERCQADASQFRAVNLARAPLPDDALEEVDAVMVGGAGEYSAMDNPPWMADLLDLVRDVHSRSMPAFGSCWGHQVFARALGGRVIHDPERAQLGCFEVQLTDAAQDDPLFQNLPARFWTNMGHHDRVVELPEGAVELAMDDSQPYQAYRVGDRPMYGTQFHSELDATRERDRLIRYRPHYPEIKTEEEFQRVLDELRETTEVDHLLHEFLVRVVLPRKD